MYDTSISLSYHVVLDDIKIIALSFVVSNKEGGGRNPPSHYASQKPITDIVRIDTNLIFVRNYFLAEHNIDGNISILLISYLFISINLLSSDGSKFSTRG